MDQTPRLALPYIAPSQTQKHVTHNEALRQLDAVVQLVLQDANALTPPALPADGQVWALGAAPVGDWAGQAGKLAVWADPAWQFVAPQSGWRAWDLTTAALVYCDGTQWLAVPASLGTPASFGINASADTANRLVVASDASLFTHDGAGHQIKINKASASDTASLLYQSGWSGRAEMGLSGSDDFAIKVSANGSDWLAALVIDKATGHAGFGTYAPARAVHIASVLRLEPSAAPASPAAGDIYYDSTSNKLRCHDGTLWHDLF
jgi:hypothetical protein